MFSYSFWADEAGISAVSAQLLEGELSIFKALTAFHYQKLHMLIIAFFFKIFGTNEFAARLPSMIGLILGTYIIFLLAKRLSNVYGGILSAFLYMFSHLNLAYATQAKPYITIEMLLLAILYVLSDKKKVNHVLVILLCTVATLLHNIGVFVWLIYFVFLALSFKQLSGKMLERKYIWILICAAVIAGIFIIPIALSVFKNGLPFKYNHMYQIMKLFAYKYSFISLCSFLGFIWLSKKQKELSIGLIVYMGIVFIFVCFVGYIFNIRYVLSFFGIIFLYFGIFWAKIGEKYSPKKPWIIPLIVVVLLYISGYKIVRGPQAYYNPNIDKYGDIQIANYKDFYSQLKQKFPNYLQLYVVNDTYDVEYWYFGRYSNAYYIKFTTKPYKYGVGNTMAYGSLDDFKRMMEKQPQGLLIMEDWQSLLPDDIKEYAKKNLHLEFRVESLREAPDDPWPLALYSWGF